MIHNNEKRKQDATKHRHHDKGTLYVVILSRFILVLLGPCSSSSCTAYAQGVNVCNIVTSTPTPPGVACTCNQGSGVVECTSTISQYCVEPEEEAVAVAPVDDECASQMSLEMIFDGGGSSLQQWSKLSRVKTCVDGYTRNGQPIVNRVCYDMRLCYDAGDDDSSICGCSVEYNQQACSDCVACPNGRGIIADCSNIDPDFYSISCVRSLRFASEWKSFDIRDDKDQAEMLERFQDDWQDEAIDFVEEWQDAWGDLLPHTLFRSDQLCDALHDFTVPVMDGNTVVEVTCDCHNAVPDSGTDNTYSVACQSTQVCNGGSSMCGTVESTATIVDGEGTAFKVCANYNNNKYQRACLSMELCDINEQHVLCNPSFTYGSVTCSASLCNQLATSISFDCTNIDVTFATCQPLDADGLMRFIPIITGGGGGGGGIDGGNAPVQATPPPQPPAPSPTAPPPVPLPTPATIISPTMTEMPISEGTTLPTIPPTIVGEERVEEQSPSLPATATSTLLPSGMPSDFHSSFPSLVPTSFAYNATTIQPTVANDTPVAPNDTTTWPNMTEEGIPPTEPIPFEKDEEDVDSIEDEKDGAVCFMTSGFVYVLLLMAVIFF